MGWYHTRRVLVRVSRLGEGGVVGSDSTKRHSCCSMLNGRSGVLGLRSEKGGDFRIVWELSSILEGFDIAVDPSSMLVHDLLSFRSERNLFFF